MPTVTLNLKDRSYDIVVGENTLAGIGTALKGLGLGCDAVVVTNPVIARHHGRALTAGLKDAGCSVKFFPVASGEKSKSARTAFRLIESIAEYSPGKMIFVVAFGGGVVGDLAGYVAAAYRRGIPCIQVPTTLLAQIDSAIGGKVGIDLPMGKNLVGAFHQPRVVYSDVKVLGTLDRRQIRNGLAEAIKYGIICDAQLFEFIEQKVGGLLACDLELMARLVRRCSAIKAHIVEQDEYETKGIRTILNFGHTIGHAIEAADKFVHYHHGEAVALGMRVAARISRELKLLDKPAVERIDALITAAGLPETIRYVRTDDIFRHMAHDKKFKGTSNRFVLSRGIGAVKVVPDVPAAVIRKAVEEIR